MHDVISIHQVLMIQTMSEKPSALKGDQSGVIACQQCWPASWDWNTDRTSPSTVSVSWKIQQHTLNSLWELTNLNTTGKSIPSLFKVYKTTSRLASELVHSRNFCHQRQLVAGLLQFTWCCSMPKFLKQQKIWVYILPSYFSRYKNNS